MRFLAGVLLLLVSLVAGAAEAPLTLDEVLACVDRAHPDLDAAQARSDAALAEMRLAQSLDDLRLTLEGALRGGRNPLLDDGISPDHFLRLAARKTLWDAGRGDLASEASRLESEARALQVLDTRSQRRLTLLARFFDVLLADMQYAADAEFAAVAYVRWEHGGERQTLGELSRGALAELEARYQAARQTRNESLRRAREKRALLANAMNQAGRLAAELAEPELKGNDRPLPEFDVLWQALRETNPRLLAQKRLLAAAQQRLQAIRAETGPSVELEAEAAVYSREAITRDDLRGGVSFVWPFFQGRRSDARLAREQAQFSLLQAEHERLLLDLRQTLFETREEILFLVETARKAAEVNRIHRDLNLERARAEYELELKTNLGGSMAETQVARLREKGIEFQLALAWERLDALLGRARAGVGNEEKAS